jgi:hypothetical protein
MPGISHTFSIIQKARLPYSTDRFAPMKTSSQCLHYICSSSSKELSSTDKDNPRIKRLKTFEMPCSTGRLCAFGIPGRDSRRRLDQCRYVPPFSGLRRLQLSRADQLDSTDRGNRPQLQEAHRGVQNKPSMEARFIPEGDEFADRTIRPDLPRPQSGRKARLGSRVGDPGRARSAGYQHGQGADCIFGYVCVNDISDRETQVDAEASSIWSAPSRG